MNSATGVLQVWTGTAWSTIGAGGGGVALPVATAAGQVLLSTGAGTTYAARDTLYLGNY
jgi:hypothetical protein